MQDLRSKIAEKASQLEEEEDMLDNSGESREDVMSAKIEAEKELQVLQKELATYSENDPTELERKKNEAKLFLKEAEEYTDQICSMEGWLQKQSVGEEEKIANFLKDLYADEYEENDGGLRDLAPFA